VDETYIRVKGEWRYLYRAVDSYPPAIMRLKAEGALVDNCRHRPVPYLNNVLEQDHRPIKRRVNASQHFRSFWAAGVVT
jgi:transposase-like protein